MYNMLTVFTIKTNLLKIKYEIDNNMKKMY